MDCDARARAAEDRARAVEHERQRAETGRQAANKELARMQVLIEWGIGRRAARACGRSCSNLLLTWNACSSITFRTIYF